ncbi:hypothetical protein G9A89_012125 [Geosiphon pyriformis]|nr:hypothetical protein G9A89_012125 [Geosiphon pyriformis]
MDTQRCHHCGSFGHKKFDCTERCRIGCKWCENPPARRPPAIGKSNLEPQQRQVGFNSVKGSNTGNGVQGNQQNGGPVMPSILSSNGVKLSTNGTGATTLSLFRSQNINPIQQPLLSPTTLRPLVPQTILPAWPFFQQQPQHPTQQQQSSIFTTQSSPAQSFYLQQVNPSLNIMPNGQPHQQFPQTPIEMLPPSNTGIQSMSSSSMSPAFAQQYGSNWNSSSYQPTRVFSFNGIQTEQQVQRLSGHAGSEYSSKTYMQKFSQNHVSPLTDKSNEKSFSRSSYYHNSNTSNAKNKSTQGKRSSFDQAKRNSFEKEKNNSSQQEKNKSLEQEKKNSLSGDLLISSSTDKKTDAPLLENRSNPHEEISLPVERQPGEVTEEIINTLRKLKSQIESGAHPKIKPKLIPSPNAIVVNGEQGSEEDRRKSSTEKEVSSPMDMSGHLTKNLTENKIFHSGDYFKANLEAEARARQSKSTSSSEIDSAPANIMVVDEPSLNRQLTEKFRTPLIANNYNKERTAHARINGNGFPSNNANEYRSALESNGNDRDCRVLPFDRHRSRSISPKRDARHPIRNGHECTSSDSPGKHYPRPLIEYDDRHYSRYPGRTSTIDYLDKYYARSIPNALPYDDYCPRYSDKYEERGHFRDYERETPLRTRSRSTYDDHYPRRVNGTNWYADDHQYERDYPSRSALYYELSKDDRYEHRERVYPIRAEGDRGYIDRDHPRSVDYDYTPRKRPLERWSN